MVYLVPFLITAIMVLTLILHPIFYAGTLSDKTARESIGVELVFKGATITEALTAYKNDHKSLPDTSDLNFLTQKSPVTHKIYLESIPVVELSRGLEGNPDVVEIQWKMVPKENVIYTVQPLSLLACKVTNLFGRGDNGVLKTVSTAYSLQCYEESKGVYKLIVSGGGDLKKAGIPLEKLTSSTAPVKQLTNQMWAATPDIFMEPGNTSK